MLNSNNKIRIYCISFELKYYFCNVFKGTTLALKMNFYFNI